MTSDPLNLATLHPVEFDVLSQFCLGVENVGSVRVVEHLLKAGLLESRRDHQGRARAQVPTHVHIAWADYCAAMTAAIDALPEALKAISLWQPWATLVAFGAKRIETRSWSTEYRGPLVIQAAKRFAQTERALCEHEPYRSALYGLEPREMPLGQALCVVDLVDVKPTDSVKDWSASIENWEAERPFGDYTPGRFAWFLENLRVLPDPVPLKGRQTLWNVSKSDVAPWTAGE